MPRLRVVRRPPVRRLVVFPDNWVRERSDVPARADLLEVDRLRAGVVPRRLEARSVVARPRGNDLRPPRLDLRPADDSASLCIK